LVPNSVQKLLVFIGSKRKQVNWAIHLIKPSLVKPLPGRSAHFKKVKPLNSQEIFVILMIKIEFSASRAFILLYGDIALGIPASPFPEFITAFVDEEVSGVASTIER